MQGQTTEALLRQNTALRERVTLLEEQLESSHSDEEQLRLKLEEINSTRNYITDQLGQLTRDYDEKAKQLENKVDRLTKLNDKLLKENAAYRQEQQLWESRFVEKERLLVGLLGQQQDVLPTIVIQPRIERPILVQSKVDKSERSIRQNKSPLQRSIDQQLEDEPVGVEQHQIETLLTQAKPEVVKAFSCDNFDVAHENTSEATKAITQTTSINRAGERDETFSQRAQKRGPQKADLEAIQDNLTRDDRQPTNLSKFSYPAQAEPAVTVDPMSEHHEDSTQLQTNQPQTHQVEDYKAPPPPPPPAERRGPPPTRTKSRIKTAEAVALQFSTTQADITKAFSPTPEPEVRVKVKEPPKLAQEPISVQESKLPPPPPPMKPKKRILADPKVLNFNEPTEQPQERYSLPLPNVVHSPKPPAPNVVHSPEPPAQSPQLLNTELDDHFQLHQQDNFASQEQQQQINAEAFFAGIAHSEISEIPHNDDITATHYFVPGHQVPSDFPVQDSFATDDDHSRSMTESVNFFDTLGKAPANTSFKPEEKKPRRSKQLKVMNPSAFN